MMHLTEEQLLRLAEKSESLLPFDAQEEEQLLHLRRCEDCYERFCAALVLLETTGDAGAFVLADALAQEREKEAAAEPGRILAAVRVAYQRLMNGLDDAVRQLASAGAALQFQPALAAGARGQAEGSGACMLKDIADAQTFLMIDAGRNELFLQLGDGLEGGKPKAYLLTDSGKRTEIPLEQSDGVYMGVLTELPAEDYQILIEQEP